MACSNLTKILKLSSITLTYRFLFKKIIIPKLLPNLRWLFTKTLRRSYSCGNLVRVNVDTLQIKHS